MVIVVRIENKKNKNYYETDSESALTHEVNKSRVTQDRGSHRMF